jgi:methylenetetrahydrofolate reductase (NADPH)
MSSYASDDKGLVDFGVEVVIKLCEGLLELGAPGLHFYTLNR